MKTPLGEQPTSFRYSLDETVSKVPYWPLAIGRNMVLTGLARSSFPNWTGIRVDGLNSWIVKRATGSACS